MKDAAGTSGTPSRNNKKRQKARAWCFTFNNYEEKDIEEMKKKLIDGEYIFGEEIGNSGTPHLQGVVRFKNPRIKKGIIELLKGCHVEQCKNWQASKLYCSKDGKTHTNILKERSVEEELLEDDYKDVVWRDWQQKVIDIIKGPVDKRKIYWFWENKGNIGKSFLAKYLILKYDCIIATGKTGDIFNQIRMWREQNKKVAQIPPVIIDNPRSEFAHINYAAIEQLKNGFLYSGKYEGGRIVGRSPHVIVFANNKPKDTLDGGWSEDRYDITEVL